MDLISIVNIAELIHFSVSRCRDVSKCSVWNAVRNQSSSRDGYRWKDVVGTDAPVLSYPSPPWFGHGPRLKMLRLGFGSRFEPLSPRLFSQFYFVRDPLPSR
ncbi:hypothetical protein AVEN_239446-1 [Araneus ventricosus]|uniref:Uncharacterized protein n=1 Tax=Araneus ventricosus TaxID=182803 RepID=A0A4Y2EYL2_ARAVE|nr:hypothetical protein AVEN_239446-1 [Araneus ventricosus]